MGLSKWLNRGPQLSVYGYRRGSAVTARSLWSGVAHRLSVIKPGGGTPVYEREWDLLVLLDACRVDALKTVAPEYDFPPGTIPSLRSVAPTSGVWLDRTFRPEYGDETAETVYVTANGHVEGIDDRVCWVEEDAFRDIEKVYDYGFDESLETIPPRPVTDTTIRTVQETDPARVIAHYMQSHTPYRGLDLDGSGVPAEKPFRETVWDWIAAGPLSRDEAWEHYLDNLRWVLDDGEILPESVDADRVVISADHGEAFGEWGGTDTHRTENSRGSVRFRRSRRLPATGVRTNRPSVTTATTHRCPSKNSSRTSATTDASFQPTHPRLDRSTPDSGGRSARGDRGGGSP